MLPSVFVIGTVFIDCKGFSKNKYHPSNRNLGTVQFVHGGVGRNVAENLANLNIPTFLVSSIDLQPIGKDVVERLKKSRVKTNYLMESKDHGMGIWIAILDEMGNLAGSVSQMPDLTLLQEFIETKGQEFFQHATHIALELDLNIHIVKSVISMAKKFNLPIYGIPSNLDLILHHREILKDLDCFICNNYEADLFLGKKFSEMEIGQKQKTLTEFVNQTGIESMVITLGKSGAVYFDSQSKEAGFQSVFPVEVVDTSGAGDAFFSGTIMGLIRGLSLKEAVICGTKVAGWTIESSENTCLNLRSRIQKDEFFKQRKLD